MAVLPEGKGSDSMDWSGRTDKKLDVVILAEMDK